MIHPRYLARLLLIYYLAWTTLVLAAPYIATRG